MTPASPTVEHFEQQRDKAETRLAELHEKRPAATVDKPSSLRDIDREIAEHTATVQNSNDAIVELNRREAERGEAEAETARQEAYERAQRLQHWREQAAAAVDSAAAELMKAIESWASIGNAQAAQLKEAGAHPDTVRMAQPRVYLAQSAIAGAARAAEGPTAHVLSDLKRTPHKGLSLAEGDIKPVAPILPDESDPPLVIPDDTPESAEKPS